MGERDGSVGVPWPADRLEIRGDQPIGPSAIAYQHGLVWPEFREAAAPKRFYVDKDIGCLGTSREKAEPTRPIEPLHRGSFPITLGDDRNVSALG
jgi:hypothetical protein